MDDPASGTAKRFFFASSIPFWMAAGTSLALPYPRPTLPSPSPTTTSAVNENRRPPLTTLATRLIAMTRSSYWPSGIRCSPSEFESCLAGAVGDARHTSVVAEATPVEHHRFDARGLRPLPDALADRLGRLHRRGRCAAAVRFDRRGRHDRPAAHVVDHLRVDVTVRPEHRQARPCRGTANLLADPPVTASACF